MESRKALTIAGKTLTALSQALPGSQIHACILSRFSD